MSRLQTTDGLTDDQKELLKLVKEFVDEQIIPVATEVDTATNIHRPSSTV